MILDGVQVVYSHQIEEHYFGKDWWDMPGEQVQQWWSMWAKENENRVHFYARPKEDFSVREAVEEAKNAGKPVVIAEDLS